MQEKKIENKIIQRFDELSHIFPEEINSSDFRVEAILKFFGNVKDKKILDVGCGKGRFSKILRDRGAVITGIDLSDELLGVAKENIKDINFVKGSATNLPFSNNSFDCVFCVEVLEHVPDCEKAIKEMVRVLKENGKVIIIDKNKLSIHRKFFLPYMLLKKYMEISNRWFYPRNFQFTEKWFFLWDIEKIIKKHCQKIEGEYLKDNKKKLFAILPFLNLFIVWKGIK